MSNETAVVERQLALNLSVESCGWNGRCFDNRKRIDSEDASGCQTSAEKNSRDRVDARRRKLWKQKIREENATNNNFVLQEITVAQVSVYTN